MPPFLLTVARALRTARSSSVHLDHVAVRNPVVAPDLLTVKS